MVDYLNFCGAKAFCLRETEEWICGIASGRFRDRVCFLPFQQIETFRLLTISLGLSFPIYRRRQAFFLPEQLRKIERVVIADRPCDDGNRIIRPGQVPARLFDSEINQVVFDGPPGCLLKNPVQVGTADIQMTGDLLHADIAFVVQLDVLQRLPQAGAAASFR